MPRPTLEEIFAEPDEFGLLTVKLKPRASTSGNNGVAILNDVTRFFEQHGRLPDANASNHEEMRLGTIWENLAKSPSDELRQADRLGLLARKEEIAGVSWRDEVQDDDIPDSLDDIFAEDGLEVQPDLVQLKHVTPAAERQVPDHRADFIPCKDFDQFAGLFETNAASSR